MARDRSLHRDGGSLCIPYLTDHDNIRVLPQNRAQCTRKGQLSLRVYLNLINAVKICLDRVLNGDNIHIIGIQFT